MITDILLKIQSSKSLSEKEIYDALEDIVAGNWSDAQIAAMLMGLSMRGESVEEIAGAAKLMRETALPIKAPKGAVDCCGTGGDKSGTYNISTAVAIVAAACDVPMAKHGNRSASSKSGAADVLEALGVNLDVEQDKLEEALKLYNFAFLMAPRHHSAFKDIGRIRKSLAVRTIFNLLGPLANPAKTEFQLIGVYTRDLVMPIAKALQKLGTKKAWVVHGSDGLDEITTTGETYVAKLEDKKITESTLNPEDFGLSKSNPKDLVGGDADTNAKALKAILNGEKNAYRGIVIANAAAVLVIAGKKTDLKEAAKEAAQALDNGEALEVLNKYIEFTRNHKTQSSDMDVLSKICAKKEDHIRFKKLQSPLNDLKVAISALPKPLGFLEHMKEEEGAALIAEVKKASPSKGIIREDFDPVQIARIYESAGATCISVLTDEPYFQGSDEFLIAIKNAVKIPVLRKDFIIDPYQVYESRVMGADCILLIMAALSDDLAAELYGLARELGMDVLVEVHNMEELERALLLKPMMVGVNNRNLKTLQVDIETSYELFAKIPKSTYKISESGIASNEDLTKLYTHGYNGFLVGESLMREYDIAIALRNLLGK